MNGAWRQRPFAQLVQHFFRRFFDADLGSQGETSLGAGPILALLTIPGALMSFVLFGKYSSLMRFFQPNMRFDPLVASIPDKYTFIAFSMAVTGIVAVLRWDTLFPDRKDFANLVPLPVRAETILFAKTLALAAFVVIFIVDVNLVSSLVFPAVVMESNGTAAELFRFIVAHAAAVAAAGTFTFLAVLAISGAAMAALPYGLYRSARRYLQFLLVTGFLLLFFSSPMMPAELRRIGSGDSSWAERLPTVWFLGLYQQIQGQGTGRFPSLGFAAIRALAFSAAAAAAGYLLSYRLFFLRSAESVDVPSRFSMTPDRLFRFVDRTALASGFDRGCFRFAIRTLARSDKHSIILAASAGLGASLVVQALASDHVDPSAILSSSLILAYSLLAGLRFSFGTPAELAANWIFRFNVLNSDADPRRPARAVLLAAVAPLLLFSVPVVALRFGIASAMLHTLYFGGVCILVIQVFTAGFRVIPFTCDWLPGRGNPVLALATFGVGLVVFGYGLGLFEYWILRSPERFLLFAGAAGAAYFAIAKLGPSEASVEFQDKRGEFDLLRISE